MFRLTCATWDNSQFTPFYERHYNSLQSAKINGTKLCKQMGSCNGVLTRYVIERVENFYSIGTVIFKKTIN